MAVLETLFSESVDALKGVTKSRIPLAREARILTYAACALILFVYFCNYWNLLNYIDFPCAPLFQENVRRICYKGAVPILIVWIVLNKIVEPLISQRIIIQNNEKNREEIFIKWWYCEDIIDFTIGIYFVLYAVNFLVDFANEKPVESSVPLFITLLYLTYCYLSKQYMICLPEYRKIRKVYTGYCDSNHIKIAVGDEIDIDGCIYSVTEYSGKLRKMTTNKKEDNEVECKNLDEVIKNGKLFFEIQNS